MHTDAITSNPDVELCTMEPELKMQRALLEQQIAKYRQAGYLHAIEAEALLVQLPSPAEVRTQAERIEVLRDTSANAYRSAKRLKQMLDELPEEPCPS